MATLLERIRARRKARFERFTTKQKEVEVEASPAVEEVKPVETTVPFTEDAIAKAINELNVEESPVVETVSDVVTDAVVENTPVVESVEVTTEPVEVVAEAPAEPVAEEAPKKTKKTKKSTTK